MADTSRHLALLGLGGRTLLLISAVLLLIAAAYKIDLRADWSHNRHYSLHPALLRLIDTQSADLDLIALWPANSNQPVLRRVEESLRLIAEQAKRIRFQHIDPDLDKALLARFEETHGPASQAIYVVRHAEERARAFRIPLDGDLLLRLEQEIGGALIALDSNQRSAVHFIQGHGELPLSAGATDSCSRLWRACELAGFDPAPFTAQDHAARGRLPESGVLVLAGPTAPLGAALCDDLARHLRDGGAALIAADHRCPDDLAQLLRQRGLLLASGLPRNRETTPATLFDTNSAAAPILQIHSATRALVGKDRRFDRLYIPAELLASHPISAGLLSSSRQALLSPETTRLIPVLPREWLPRLPDLAARFQAVDTPLFQTTIVGALPGSEAWLVRPSDWQAPAKNPDADRLHPFLCATEYRPHPDSVRTDQGARLVVWSSRAALADEVLESGTFGNERLLIDSIAWLADQQPPTGIPPTRFDAIQVTAEERAMYGIMVVLVILLPMACIGGAMITWWERR